MSAMVTEPGPRFACDAMLGGLTRWLRAAGYDASWRESISDPELVRLARAQGRTVLSSDGDVFDFALVRDGAVPALFVPRGLTVQAQLAHVLRGLGLPLREPRCMACGGELLELTKEEAAGRVPPRSLAFHDRFWVCPLPAGLLARLTLGADRPAATRGSLLNGRPSMPSWLGSLMARLRGEYEALSVAEVAVAISHPPGDVRG
jgi:uncharacterized protein with PIN domain